MRKIGLSLLVALPVLLAGCVSPGPVATNFPISEQKKVRHAHHWDVVADDVVTQTLQTLAKSNYIGNQALHVRPAQENTAFNKAFRNFLITNMVNRGLPVSSSSQNAIEVQYETQVVRHVSDRIDYKPGIVTMLAGGLYAIHDLADSEPVAAGVALTAAIDLAGSFRNGGPSKTELIVTTSISSGSRFVMRKTDVYYFDEADVGLFQEQEQKSREWKVKGE